MIATEAELAARLAALRKIVDQLGRKPNQAELAALAPEPCPGRPPWKGPRRTPEQLRDATLEAVRAAGGPISWTELRSRLRFRHGGPALLLRDALRSLEEAGLIRP